MTVAKTIQLAQQHAHNGNFDGACRILNAAMRSAKSGRSQRAFDIAKSKILDAAVDATVARSQVRQ